MRARMRAYRLLCVVAAAGLLVGALITVLTFLTARYGPTGHSWSFRGDGALAVPAGLAPALVAAGWVMLVVHYRSERRWPGLGVGAGLVGVAFAAADAALIPVGGAGADQTAGPVLLVLLFAWTVVAPVAASLVPVSGRTERPPIGPYLSSFIALPPALLGGFSAMSLVIPPGS
jgi:hypothetical protein